MPLDEIHTADISIDYISRIHTDFKQGRSKDIEFARGLQELICDPMYLTPKEFVSIIQ